MIITKKYRGKSGVDYIFEYQDSDSFDNLDYSKCRQVYGICFMDDDKMIIGFDGKKTIGD